MYTKTALIATLAGSAAAIIDVRPDVVRRDAIPTQTDVAADPCLNALATVYANAPTPPPKVVSYEMTAAPQTNPCSIALPSELSADYASYTSQVLSWVSANSASIASAVSVCSTLTDLTTELALCTATDSADTTESTTAASGSSATKEADGGDSPSATGTAHGAGHTGAPASNVTGTRNSPTQVAPNSGPRETGMMAAVVAAAGFIGVFTFL
ncbi:hypothetical protein EsH8_IX_000081 [Colletotrichum jinshuiense]